MLNLMAKGANALSSRSWVSDHPGENREIPPEWNGEHLRDFLSRELDNNRCARHHRTRIRTEQNRFNTGVSPIAWWVACLPRLKSAESLHGAMKRAKALNSVILAAGDGTRLRSNRPKVLHEVCGHPMLHYVLRVAAEAAADRHVIVVGYEGEQICQTFAGRSDVIFAEQKERLGTGHAVQMTREAFEGYEGDILILAGDTPLLTAQTLQNLVQWHRHQEAAVTILTTEMPEPRGYGRILRYEDNRLQGIVEEKDANRYERAIREINTGSYCFDARALFEALDQVTPQNVQNEYYLTDCVRILVEQGHRAEAVITDDHTEAIGVNTRVQLAEAEKILRQRILVRHMMAGITILDPETCYVDEEVEIGKDSVLFPGTMITGKSRIGADCRIGPNTQIVSAELGDGVVANSSYIEGVKLPSGATVGPFATLRNTTSSQKDSGN